MLNIKKFKYIFNILFDFSNIHFYQYFFINFLNLNITKNIFNSKKFYFI
jgi:hypothetical protein